MKKITNREEVIKAMQELNVYEALGDFISEISIFEYETHELLMSPVKPNENLIFLLEGSLIFYLIEESGHILSVGRTDWRTMMGEEKLFDSTHETIYVEARSKVRILAVPYELCHREREHNVAFLQIIIQKMLQKSNHERQFPGSTDTIRDKFLFYIQYLCPDKQMTSVNEAAETINCSCRQLHRVLNDLTAEGVISHIGKGIYKMSPRDGGSGSFIA